MRTMHTALVRSGWPALAVALCVACSSHKKAHIATSRDASLTMQDFVWEYGCARPFVDPPTDFRLSLADYLRIQDDLQTFFYTRARERNLDLTVTAEVLFAVVDEHQARVVVFARVPFRDRDRVLLGELAVEAQRLFVKAFEHDTVIPR